MIPDNLRAFLRSQDITKKQRKAIIDFIETESATVIELIESTMEGNSVALPISTYPTASPANLTLDLHSEDFETTQFSDDRRSSGRREAPQERKEQLARYEVLGPLGTGGMGQVLRVKDPELNRSLAMKIIHKDLLENRNAMARFIEEGQVGAQLQHPNIIPVHEIGVLPDGRLYFTMKEIQGREFTSAIREVHEAVQDNCWQQTTNNWSFHRLIDVFQQVCSAISYAHSRGVIHRDLKPSNIMIGAFGEVLVVDWGIAKVIGHNHNNPAGDFDAIVTNRTKDLHLATRMGQVAGTPAYMSPEQAKGQIDKIDGRSDIYALGAILYEILKGAPPYVGKDGTDVLEQVLSGPPISLLTGSWSFEEEEPEVNVTAALHEDDEHADETAPLPDELVEACEKAMSRDQADRFQTAEELMNAIKDWLDGARKRERSLVLVDQARSNQQKAINLKKNAVKLQKMVKEQYKSLAKGVPISEKYAIWDLEKQAKQAMEEALLLEAERLRLLQGALIEFPSSPEALGDLAENCIRSHQKAMQNKEHGRAQSLVDEALSYLKKLPEQNPIRLKGSSYFAGQSNVEIILPMAAKVTVERFEVIRKRMIPQGIDLIHSNHYQNKLSVGSYQLLIQMHGHHEVVYPFLIEHGKSWKMHYSSKQPLAHLPIPKIDEMGLNECYVPPGWFYAGGDPEAPNGQPEKKAWADGFMISKTPVTHQEYIAFLNDVLSSNGKDAALRWVPREQSNSERELGKPIYLLQDDGFQHPLGSKMNRHPAVHVTWYSALAYSQWLANKTGLPWRLPLELEWEKSARGVDRRRFPWGDDFDSSFCIMMDSHVGATEIKSVDANLFDMSVYGVQSCAGNTREWCLDLFMADGLPIEQGRLKLPSQSNLLDAGFRSSRGGSFGNASTRTRSADRDWWFPHLSYIGRGFRIARSWPVTPESRDLQQRISKVFEGRSYRGGVPTDLKRS